MLTLFSSEIFSSGLVGSSFCLWFFLMSLDRSLTFKRASLGLSIRLTYANLRVLFAFAIFGINLYK